MILQFVLSYVVGMEGILHCTQPLIEMGPVKVLPKLALNCGPSNLCLPSSWDYSTMPAHYYITDMFLNTCSPLDFSGKEGPKIIRLITKSI
jgi:hypothetical protein